MKKSIIVMGLTSLVFIGSALYAGGHEKVNCGINDKDKAHMMKKCHMKKTMGHNPFFKALHQLDLSKEQMASIKEIMMNKSNKIQMTSDAFTKNSFDQDKYVDIALNKYKNMVESKAKMINDMYAVLTNKQKEELKVLMDLDSKKAHRGMKYDKHCNGRG